MKEDIFSEVFNGNFEAVKAYVNNMGSLTVKNAEGETILHAAIQNGHENIVKLLLETGANISTTNNNAETAFKLVLNCANFWDPQPSKISIAKMLVGKGADVNTLNRYHRTGLHLAVMANDVELASMLKSKGVNIEVEDEYKWTALNYAATKADPAMLPYIQ